MRNAIIALTTATALTASTFALAAGPAQGQVAPHAALAIQKVTLSISPGISQNGEAVANANNAWVVGGAKVSPVRQGRAVRVERRASSLAPWQTVTSGRTDSAGVYRFKADGASGSTPYEFRAIAAATSTLARAVGTAKSSSDWKLKFDDQFNGSRLDLSKWSYRKLGVREGSRLHAQSSTSSVGVGGGALHLRVRKNPNRRGYYLNGHISTQDKFSYTYGTSAARIKFAMRRGQHGAFWSEPQTQATSYGSPSLTGAEIDTVEFFGKGYPRGGLAHFVYSHPRRGVSTKYGNVFPNAAQALQGRSDSWWSRYHVFSVDWTSNGYVFRIDGDITWRTSKAVSKQPQYLILSLLTSDWELPQLQPSTLPSDMKIDWVRAWQR